MQQDAVFMSKALGLAQKINGSSYPSPPVGCVIVKEGKIIATGTTQPSGGNHAEAVALQKAASHAHGAVLYVTLEPCTHWENTLLVPIKSSQAVSNAWSLQQKTSPYP